MRRSVWVWQSLYAGWCMRRCVILVDTPPSHSAILVVGMGGLGMGIISTTGLVGVMQGRPGMLRMIKRMIKERGKVRKGRVRHMEDTLDSLALYQQQPWEYL